MNYLINEFDKAELLRIIKKIDSIRGAGVINGKDSIVINPPVEAYFNREEPRMTAVDLTKDGGSDGVDGGAAATYTYTATRNGQIIATGIPLLGKRVLAMSGTVPAIVGYVEKKYSGSGSGSTPYGWVVTWCDEHYPTNACT